MNIHYISYNTYNIKSNNSTSNSAAMSAAS